MVCFTYLKIFLEIGLAGHTTDIPVWTKQLLVSHSVLTQSMLHGWIQQNGLCWRWVQPLASCKMPGRVVLQQHMPSRDGFMWKTELVCSFLTWSSSRDVNIAQLICTLAPAVYKPMLNSAAWDIPQAQCMSFGAVMQWCSWLLLSLVLPPALAASSSLSIVS